MRRGTVLWSVILTMVLVGCSRSASDVQQDLLDDAAERPGVKLNEVRSTPPDLKVVKVAVNRADFQRSFTEDDKRKTTARSFRSLRLVPVFDKSASGTGMPSYRLFGIARKSPYDYLGLRDGDVVVAANGYVLFQPIKFKQYVYLLQQEEEAQVEIRRGGVPILLTYTFVE